MSINIPKKRVESLEGSLDSKQNKLVAGQGISIDDTDPKNPIISSLGGGEGTNNYNELENQPRLNSVVLEGNKTAKDLSIFDKTTLIGGKNITIDEVLPEGGIDQYTLAVAHFEGQYITENSVEGKDALMGSSGSLTSDYSKFGTKCVYNPTIGYQNTGLAEDSDWTIDTWVRFYAISDGWCSSLCIGYGDLSTYDWQVKLDPYNQTANIISDVVRNSGTTKSSSQIYIQINEWYHFAAEKNGNTITGYLNGNPVVSYTGEEVKNTSSYRYLWIYNQPSYADELRFSTIARYEGKSFIPPNQPYSKSEPTGKWEINSSSDPLKPATTDSLGGIKVGNGLSITEDGTLNNEGYSSNDFTTPLKVKLQGIEENANNFSTSFNPETNTLIFSKGVK